MAEASWLPDPLGVHELRYWTGTAWSEHVSDQGVTTIDPLDVQPPPPAPAAAFPPPPPPAYGASAAPPGGKVSWKDRLKQVADQGKAMAEQGKQKVAEQQSKRTEQWANDPNTLWFGESKGAATSVMGVSKARYRVTRDRVWIESGLLGTKTENVPLWSVKDIDVRQALWQRDKDIGDVVLTLDDASYAAAPTEMFSMTGMADPSGTASGQVVLDNIENPYGVVDILSPLISEARHKKTVERQSQYLHVNPGMAGAAFGAPPAAPPPPAAPQTDMVEQLRKLGELRDAGILTEEEFAAQKAKILGA
jgi:hypothetical protein